MRWVTVPDMRFRERLREIVERAHRIAGAWDALASLPFQTLATWSSADLDWLREPLDPEADREWVAALPKIELHCHLGGFATRGSLLREVRSAAAQPDRLPSLQEPPLPAHWPLPTHPISAGRIHEARRRERKRSAARSRLSAPSV